VVDAPALDPQAPVNQPPSPSHVAPGQLPDPLLQLVLLKIRHRHWPALGGAVLAGQTAGTALRSPESILQDNNSPAATFRAQKFPSATSHCCAEAKG
jgi:hypothetical protein